MTATITESLKRTLIDNLITDIETSNYYIGIGKSEEWNDSDIPTTPVNTLDEERNFRNSLQSIKSAENVSFVVPRNTWSSGTIYSAFNQKTENHPETPYFVINSENDVYVCLERGRNSDGTLKPSTVKPTGNSTSKLETADGYTWQYLYSISNTRESLFLTSNYIPVQYIDSAGDAVETLQENVQNATVNGQILNIEITDGGSGYTTAPTVVISGDGSGAAATATVSGGEVKRIKMDSNGSGYNNAKITFSGGGGGTGATAYATISPGLGIGANAKESLRAKAIMFNTKPDGTEGGTFIIGNDFRQVGIIRNPRDYSASLFTGVSANALKHMVVVSTANFSVDQTLTGSTSGSKALIDYIDSDKIYFHQNHTTGFGLFDSDVGGLVTAPGASSTLTTLVDSADIDNLSGEILYIENRSAIIRSNDQTEDIKVVIGL